MHKNPLIKGAIRSLHRTTVIRRRARQARSRATNARKDRQWAILTAAERALIKSSALPFGIGAKRIWFVLRQALRALDGRKGRASHNPEGSASMLEVAASAITLTRKFGRGRFSEAQLRVYPDFQKYSHGADTVARPYPADADVVQALRDSDLPAALLVVSTLDICRPVPTDVTTRNAGKKFVAWVARNENWTRRGKRMTRADRLTQLAIRALYEFDLKEGRIPVFGRKNPAPLIYLRLGLQPRMRTYWRKHTARDAAWALVVRLAKREREADGSNLPAFQRSAMAEYNEAPATNKEKSDALARAQSLWEDKYRPRVANDTALNEHQTPDSDSGDFRDAIEC